MKVSLRHSLVGFSKSIQWLPLEGESYFLFPPLGFFSSTVLATLSLPNITFGILVWYIDPPENTPPNQLKPYTTFTQVPLVVPTPSFSSFPKKTQLKHTLTTKESHEGGNHRERQPNTRHPIQLQILLSHQSLLLHVLCVMLLVMPPLIILISPILIMSSLIPFPFLIFLSSMSPYYWHRECSLCQQREPTWSQTPIRSAFIWSG